MDDQNGCQIEDADAFCRLKHCDKNAFAIDFTVTAVANETGYSCQGIGTKVDATKAAEAGMIDVYYAEDMKGAHRGNETSTTAEVVSNVVCNKDTGNNTGKKPRVVQNSVVFFLE